MHSEEPGCVAITKYFTYTIELVDFNIKKPTLPPTKQNPEYRKAPYILKTIRKDRISVVLL